MLDQIKAVLALRHNERGVTAMEYGLIAGILSTVLAAAVPIFGGAVGTAFTVTAAKLAFN